MPLLIPTTFRTEPSVAATCSDERTKTEEAIALLRDRRIHPASLHHALRWPKAQIVHVIRDVVPSVHDARRDDHHVADLHGDFSSRHTPSRPQVGPFGPPGEF